MPPEDPRPGPAGGGQGSGGNQRSRRWIIGSLAALAILFIVIFSITSGGGKPSSNATVNPPTYTNPPSAYTGTSPEEPKPTPQPPPTPTKVEYSNRELTFARNDSYNVNQLPINRDMPNGYEVTDDIPYAHGYHLVVIGAGSVASWTGAGQPYLKDCKRSLASAAEEVPLPTVGHWLCTETENHQIARLRYDGSTDENEFFHFAATMYIPGHS